MRPIEEVELKQVESFEDVQEFFSWLSRSRSFLGWDTETTGLNPFGVGEKLRLFQFGDLDTGWVFRADRWLGVLEQVMNTYEGRMVGQNVPFDIRWTEHHSDGIKVPWGQQFDTKIMGHILDPTRSTSLKAMSARFLSPAAKALQGALDSAMRKQKWTWASVPYDFEIYTMYAAFDPVLTARIAEDFWPKIEAEFLPCFELESDVQRVCSNMEVRGIKLDIEYCSQRYEDILRFTSEADRWCVENYGIHPGQNQEVALALVREGIDLSKLTATGDFAMDRDVLEGIDHPLAKTVAEHRKATKIGSTYFRNYLEGHTNGILHPSINTLGARTGRMCLPYSYGILTDSGVKHPSVIIPGDLTLGINGWTIIKDIHLFESATVREYHEYIRCTPEHRWIWESDRGYQHIEPVEYQNRATVVGAPELIWDDSVEQDKVQFAALIGLLVSDGRVSEPTQKGIGMRASIYQDEDKFLEAFLQVIPEEALMGDTARKPRDNGKINHEIRIKARWLRPRLADAGLFIKPGTVLKDSPNLVSWVRGLSINESAAFLYAVYLADGSTSQPRNKVISCSSIQLRESLQIAGYRCGLLSTVNEVPKGNSWAVKQRMNVVFRQPRLFLRSPRNTYTETTEPVWCVTTEDGTFTAWDYSHGPILTGNSIQNPAAQTLPRGRVVRDAFIPRPGNMWLCIDFSNIEMKLLAHFAQDPGMLEAARSSDMHLEMAKLAFHDGEMLKGDARRQIMKNANFAKAFVAGVEKFAWTAGIELSDAAQFLDKYDHMFPGVKTFQSSVIQTVKQRASLEGRGWARSPLGRKHLADKGKEYAVVNYLVQGTAAEAFKSALVDLDNAGYGQYMLLPVHDEQNFEVPIEHADDMKHDIEEIMVRTNYSLPLTVEGSLGRSWGEAK